MALAAGPGVGHASLPVAPPNWPEWTIEVSREVVEVRHGRFAFPLLSGGTVDLDDEARRVVIAGAPRMPTDAEMMHPWLSSIAASISFLAGQDNFHAGGVVIEGRVWAVIGAKEAGKSTALVDLWVHGYLVVSDDLVVIDGETSLSGPGCIDLRGPSAGFLGLGEELLDLGPGRERHRVWTTPPPPELPFAGFVLPQWGHDVSVERASLTDSLAILAGARSMYHVDRGERALLRLLAFPVLRWTRRRDLTELGRAREELVSAIGRRS